LRVPQIEFWESLTMHGLERAVAALPSSVLAAILVFGTLLLCYAADRMVEGSVHTARRTGLPRVLIGTTIIAIGTSIPEAFISVTAAWMGNPALALGNGVGSVICNTGLIFGLTCLIWGLPANRYILNRAGWVQLGSALLLVLLCIGFLAASPSQPVIPRWVGLFFMGILAGYMYLTYLWGRQTSLMGIEPDMGLPLGLARSLLLMGAGLTGVLLASRIIIPVASETAIRIGVPDDVVAATIVALGTSLPELVTAFSAVRKGYPSIMLGAIVGSDVINILFVVGAAALAAPLEITANFFYFHFPAMLIILVTFRIFIAVNAQGAFKRWQGGVILGWYGLYILGQYIFNLG
jgi:cation:H+ antiporter